VDFTSVEDVLIVLTPPPALDAVDAAEPGTGARNANPNREPGT
jgi:hypothetical protein